MPASSTASSQHRRLPKLTIRVARAFEVVDEERFTFSQESRKVRDVKLLACLLACLCETTLHYTQAPIHTPRHRYRILHKEEVVEEEVVVAVEGGDVADRP